MKKILSFLLAIAMLAVMAVPVSAYSPQNPDSFEEVKAVIKPLFEDEFSTQTGGKIIKDIEIISTNENYTIFQLSTDSYEKTEYFNRFGNFYEKRGATIPVYGSNIIVAKTDGSGFYTLEQAYNQNIIGDYDFNVLPLALHDFGFGEVGATQYPYLLNISQATALQKMLLNITETVDVRIVDFDGNGRLTITDVTAIQKELAK